MSGLPSAAEQALARARFREIPGYIATYYPDGATPLVATDVQAAITELSERSSSGGATLTATAERYFAPTGSDSNDGSIGSPWLTLQHGFNTFASYNFNAYGANFNIAAGTYVGNITAFATLNGYISIVGAGRATTILEGSIALPYAGAVIAASDVTVKTIGAKISVGQGASFGGVNMAFDANGGSGGVMTCSGGALGDLSGDIELYGTAFSYLVSAVGNSTASFTPNTLTLANTPNWGTAGVRADTNSSVTFSYSTLVGTATGVRFASSRLSGVWTATGDVNYIPGDVAGTADSATGGFYS